MLPGYSLQVVQSEPSLWAAKFRVQCALTSFVLGNVPRLIIPNVQGSCVWVQGANLKSVFKPKSWYYSCWNNFTWIWCIIHYRDILSLPNCWYAFVLMSVQLFPLLNFDWPIFLFLLAPIPTCVMSCLISCQDLGSDGQMTLASLGNSRRSLNRSCFRTNSMCPNVWTSGITCKRHEAKETSLKM